MYDEFNVDKLIMHLIFSKKINLYIASFSLKLHCPIIRHKTVSNNNSLHTNYPRKLQTFAYLHQQNRSRFKVRKIHSKTVI